MHREVKQIIEKFGLEPHPEGGYFRETYRSNGIIPQKVLGDAFSGGRNYCTAIYFLIPAGGFSAFHRLRQDEMWHFYSGSVLYVHVIDKQGNYIRHAVGNKIDKGEVPQLVVPAGCWFASSAKEDAAYAFVGCTVTPGFDFADFELAKREELQALYPQHEQIIEQFTRE